MLGEAASGGSCLAVRAALATFTQRILVGRDLAAAVLDRTGPTIQVGGRVWDRIWPARSYRSASFSNTSRRVRRWTMSAATPRSSTGNPKFGPTRIERRNATRMLIPFGRALNGLRLAAPGQIW